MLKVLCVLPIIRLLKTKFLFIISVLLVVGDERNMGISVEHGECLSLIHILPKQRIVVVFFIIVFVLLFYD